MITQSDIKRIKELHDNELRLEIAKALGWTCGNGPMDMASMKWEKTEFSPWWITPEGRATSVLPDWPIDINLTMYLVNKNRDFIWSIYQLHKDGVANSWAIDIDKISWNEHLETVVTLINFDSTASIAICRAWLILMETIK